MKSFKLLIEEGFTPVTYGNKNPTTLYQENDRRKLLYIGMIKGKVSVVDKHGILHHFDDEKLFLSPYDNEITELDDILSLPPYDPFFQLINTNMNKHILMIVFFTFLLTIFIATGFYFVSKDKRKKLDSSLQIIKKDSTFNLTATTYAQYLLTASGGKIDKLHPLKHHWVALSRDLLKRFSPDNLFKYGDTLFLSSNDKTFPYWGLWIVKDSTAKGIRKKNGKFKEIKNTIDLLVGRGQIMGKWQIQVQKYNHQ